MIISRTPFRISFVGGGTDIRSFYSEEPGQVLSTSIDKYIYVVVKRQIGIVEFKYRVNWSQVEFRNRIDDIEHPIVREALKLLEIDFPIEITTLSEAGKDMPDDDRSNRVLGFILGAGAFTTATQAGQGAHRLGAFNSMAVAVAMNVGVEKYPVRANGSMCLREVLPSVSFLSATTNQQP